MNRTVGYIDKKNLTEKEKLFNKRWLFAYKPMCLAGIHITEDNIQSMRAYLWEHMDYITEISERKHVTDLTITFRLCRCHLYEKVLMSEGFVRIPTWLNSKVAAYNSLMNKNSKLTDLQIMEALNIPKGTLRSIRKAINAMIIIRDTYEGDDKIEQENSIEENYFTDNCKSINELESKIDKNLMLDKIRNTLKILTPREYAVITKRYPLSDNSKFTILEDLAKEFGCSYQSIRQTEKRAIEKLKRSINR